MTEQFTTREQRRMVINDVGKLLGLATITIGLFILVAIGRVEWDAALPIFTLEVGYLTGNGVSAVRRSAPSPVVVPALEPGTMATIHGPVQAGGEDPGPTQHFLTDEDGNL